MSSLSKRIRIVGLPPGEAPIEIRQAWIGLELPLAAGKYQKEQNVRELGVITGPRSFLGLLAAQIFQRGTISNSFVVESTEALKALLKERPEAAEWWKENLPHLFKPGRRLAFNSDICEEVVTE